MKTMIYIKEIISCNVDFKTEKTEIELLGKYKFELIL